MMRNKKGKDLSFKKKLLAVGLTFLFLVLLIATFFGKRGLIEVYQAQRNNNALIQEKERLKQEKDKLQKDIEELEKNPKAVEKKAREKLWLMKPDEIVIIKK